MRAAKGSTEKNGMTKKTTVKTVKVTSPKEIGARAERSTLYPKDVSTFQKDATDGVFANKHGIWLLQPEKSSLAEIPFSVTRTLVNREGKPVKAFVTKDETEVFDSACVVVVGGKLQQGYVAKDTRKQPVTLKHRLAQPKDRPNWEGEWAVTKGEARGTPLYFVA